MVDTKPEKTRTRREKTLAERLQEGTEKREDEDDIRQESASDSEEEEEELPPPPKSMGTNLSFSLMEQGLLAMSASLGFSKIDSDTVDRQREKMIEKMPLVHKDPETGEDTWEKLLVFFEDTEEVRAEPELGGLGAGLTGEYTLYSFVVGWCPSKKSVSAAKKWKMKMRFSQFYAFDQHLQQYLRQLGIDETRLPEFPEKVYFGHMSPSLVKERKAALEFYFQELVKDKELTREPIVRAFLKLPMSTEDVQALESEYSVSGDGLMAGMGEYKSRLQITREEKAKGKHHTQKKETFAGAPTLAGAAEVGTAFAKSSVDDSGAETKWTFRIPILADFGGQRVGDIFGDEVRGLHSTYNNKIKKQIEKSSQEKRKKDKTGKEYFITSDGYDQDGNYVG